MSTSRKLPTSYNTSTYGDATRDYTSLGTWEAAKDTDLVTAAKGEVLKCYADSSSFNDAVTLDGATTNSSYYRVIMPAAGEGHDGTPTAGVRFYYAASGALFTLTESYSQFHDIVVKNTSTGSMAISFSLGDSTSRVIGCIAYDNTGAADLNIGFYTEYACGLVNCLATNIDGGGSWGVDAGFYLSTSNNAFFYNCTATDSSHGYYANSVTGIAKNCVCENNTTNWVGTWTKTTCTDDDGVTFVDSSNDDFHLDSTDTDAINSGTDLSSDGTFAFDDDIDGDTRTGTWDIGFDEYISATANACFFGCNF